MPLAGNLLRRSAMVKAVYPTMTIYSLGDTAHQSERSDHNPDSRNVWHAIDIMTRTDSSYDGAAAKLLAWLLSDTTDLQYAIHDRLIYSITNDFRPVKYTGTNPHTDHIHASGRHGSIGYSNATGTGYSVTAENYTPSVTYAEYLEEMDMPTADEIASALMKYVLPDKGTFESLLVQLRARTNTTTNVQIPEMVKDLDAIADAIPGKQTS